MKIRALKQFPIAPDGIRTRMLDEGAVVDVSAELGEGLVKAGLAEEVGPDADAAAEHNKALLSLGKRPQVAGLREVLDDIEARLDGKEAEPDEDNPFGDDDDEAEEEAEPAKPKPRGRPRRENKDAGSRSRRS